MSCESQAHCPPPSPPSLPSLSSTFTPIFTLTVLHLHPIFTLTDMAEVVFFSGVTSMEKLTELFARTFRVTEEMPKSTSDLLTNVFHGQLGSIESVAKAYFLSCHPVGRVDNVPPCLEALLRLMRLETGLGK